MLSIRRLWSLVMSPYFALTDPKLLLLTVFFVAAFLGITHSPLWCEFTRALLLLLPRTPHPTSHTLTPHPPRTPT